MSYLSNTIKGLFLSCVLTGQTNAENLSLNFLTNPNSSREINRETYVDKRVFFLMDVSSSMKDDERNIMYEGISNAFKDKDIEFALSSGNLLAINVVAFASDPYMSGTYTSNSIEGAKSSISEILWDDESESHKEFNIGNNTLVSPALDLIIDSLETSEIRSEDIVVIYIGDDKPLDPNAALKRIKTLNDIYGVKFYAGPILPAENQTNIQYFSAVANNNQDLGENGINEYYQSVLSSSDVTTIVSRALQPSAM